MEPKHCFVTSAVPFQVYEDARRHAAAHGLPPIDRNSARRSWLTSGSLGEAMEGPLPEAGPPPGPRWNTWDIAFLPVVDTARIGLVNVRVWRF